MIFLVITGIVISILGLYLKRMGFVEKDSFLLNGSSYFTINKSGRYSLSIVGATHINSIGRFNVEIENIDFRNTVKQRKSSKFCIPYKKQKAIQYFSFFLGEGNYFVNINGKETLKVKNDIDPFKRMFSKPKPVNQLSFLIQSYTNPVFRIAGLVLFIVGINLCSIALILVLRAELI